MLMALGKHGNEQRTLASMSFFMKGITRQLRINLE